MKNILFILFLFSSVLNAQIVINKTFVGLATTTTDASAYGIPNHTYTAGRLYIYFAITTGTTNAGTISGNVETTWDAVVSTGDATRRIQIFRCMPTVTTASTEDVNIGGFGSTASGSTIGIWEITGIDQSGTNGSGAITQTTTGGATGIDPTLTLSALMNSNAVIAIFFNDLNPFGGTNESGWAEDFDSGYTTPDAGTYVTSRVNGADNTPMVTAASSTWVGVAIEFKSGFRRIIITN